MSRSPRKRQIIAISGRAFASSSTNHMSLFDYALAQSNQKSPKVGLLNQASAEDPHHAAFFEQKCHNLGAIPTQFSLFGRVDLKKVTTEILKQDLIFVGGGNTLSMLALWKAYDLDQTLYQAYQKGCVLAGVSAGAICWFEQAMSDSVWPLAPLEGLKWIKGSLCTHYDSEVERRPLTLKSLKDKKLIDGFALDDFTAIHFINETPHRFISSQSERFIYRINQQGEQQIIPEFINQS